MRSPEPNGAPTQDDEPAALGNGQRADLPAPVFQSHSCIKRSTRLTWSTCSPQRHRGLTRPVAFATKPELAQTMLARALDAGVPARWVAADEVYGADPGLRAALEAREVGYVQRLFDDLRAPLCGRRRSASPP